MCTCMARVEVKDPPSGERSDAESTDYLEYKIGTIKTYNARNNFLDLWFIQIP
jgi:hypothetical protein